MSDETVIKVAGGVAAATAVAAFVAVGHALALATGWRRAPSAILAAVLWRIIYDELEGGGDG